MGSGRKLRQTADYAAHTHTVKENHYHYITIESCYLLRRRRRPGPNKSKKYDGIVFSFWWITLWHPFANKERRGRKMRGRSRRRRYCWLMRPTLRIPCTRIWCSSCFSASAGPDPQQQSILLLHRKEADSCPFERLQLLAVRVSIAPAIHNHKTN